MGTEQAGESDLRRRAAWLLGMLVLVAALVVVLMLTLLKGSGGGKQGAGPDDPYASPSAVPATSSAPGPSTSSAPSTGSTAPTSASRTASTRSCPSDQSCALQGDPGDAIAAVDAYRAQHGQKRVDGTVSKSAQACALSNGSASACSGGWAESQLGTLDGSMAVKKIANIGNSGLLDSQMTSFQVGWAYSPRAHQYFIAIIHTD